jgi:glycerophosphoryl diester phosphodiesterase
MRSFDIVAHRGDPSVALENTMAAFYAALESGADRIELDVWPSKDGEFYIQHDESLERYCGIPRLISTMHTHELADCKLANGEPLCRMDNVLEHIATQIEINVEIKFPTRKWVNLLVELVSQYEGNIKPILWSSFHIPILDELRVVDSRQSIAILCGPESENPNPKKLKQQCEKLNAKVAHPWIGYCDADLMSQLSGIKVVPYCGFREESQQKESMWQKLIDLKVDGFCTNYPKELRAWLRSQSII